jgi:hypothetical protein
LATFSNTFIDGEDVKLAIQRHLLAGLVVASTALLPAAAGAAVIVDTGPGPSAAGGVALGSNQRGLAAEFSVATGVTVNSIELWMNSFLGSYTAAIFTDGGDLPGSELFSSPFTPVAGVAGWGGASGLSWNLAAGTYWAVFQVRSGQDGSGVAPVPSTSPLGNEAFMSAAATWVAGDGMQLGVRIQGAEGTAPEPGTFALLGLGLAGLAATRRRKK